MKEKGKSIKVYLLGMLIVGIGMGLTTVIADTIINSTNVSYKTSTVKAALDDLYGLTADDIWKKIYPIGSIYTSVSPTSPATLFGGTWERFGNGKAIVGVDESDDDFKTVALTGGSKTKTIAVGNLPVHNHPIPKLGGSTTAKSANTGSAGAHTHTYSLALETSRADYCRCTEVHAPNLRYESRNTSSSGSHSHGITIPSLTVSTNASNTNGCTDCNGTALNTQDPYITVYMWKRTA